MKCACCGVQLDGSAAKKCGKPVCKACWPAWVAYLHGTAVPLEPERQDAGVLVEKRYRRGLAALDGAYK